MKSADKTAQIFRHLFAIVVLISLQQPRLKTLYRETWNLLKYSHLDKLRLSCLLLGLQYSSLDKLISFPHTQDTVKVLNFWTPKMFAVINLKFKQRGFSIEKIIQNMQIEWQTVQTQIRLIHYKQSDLGLHCLPIMTYAPDPDQTLRPPPLRPV